MPDFEVEVVWTARGWVTVEAESEEQAADRARDEYWGYPDLEVTHVKELE